MQSILTVTALAVALVGGVAQDQVYKIGAGIKAPVLVKEVKPVYTEPARRRKAQGTVELSVIILTDGAVGDVTITRSLDQELDQQAIHAVRQWTFKPGTKNGEPVNVQVSIELTFSLRDRQ